MSKRTENALIARGFDTTLAKTLAIGGYTLSKLKTMQVDDLISIGIDEHLAAKLMKEPRPAIPQNILCNVLFNNRRTCCVCRDASKSVVVHHIIEWSKSRSHAEENLSVLCLEHHDLAHTTKHLSQNLTADEILFHKALWESQVSLIDSQTLLRLRRERSVARWDWINIPRVFEIFSECIVEFEPSPVIDNLKKDKVIDDRGMLLDESHWECGKSNQQYFIDFGGGCEVASYLGGVLEAMIQVLPIIDITSMLQHRGQIRSLITYGSYIGVQAPFYFSTLENHGDHRQEVRRAYYQGYGVKIEFTYQPWFCTSSSAKHSGMSGRRVQTVIGFVRDISSIDGELVISISCLAAGTGFKTHEGRVLPNYERYA
ncbi:HNH endonuclease signature motif containing protein [Vibrio algivorus]|uniref:HNH endonuclease n=1 Tax=Vibrio algivorus TaxID=1667024 RepID=A0ABQ6EMV3_9VIBR|nr:HNH endonuclease signature motif containing protein [Vibrio algivorus]GLT14316.1 hypothetical protein GCM10007931_12910 [Vibrio algivorus]